MEIPGFAFAVNIGLVNQSTLAPVGVTFPFKMRKAERKGTAGPVRTGHNMNLGFDSAIRGLRKCIIRVEALESDGFPVGNTWNAIPTGLGGTDSCPFQLFEGLYIRIAMTPIAAALDGIVLAGNPRCYLFPGALITGSDWSPDAEQGQPVSLEFETVIPYSTPGETLVPFTF